MNWVRLAAVAMLALLAGPASAGAAGGWAGDSRGEVRLIGAGGKGGTIRAGIEIRLQPGWKTYWKAPGDSGVPPVFDWSSSANVTAVQVGWPVPRRFDEKGDVTFGYEGDVILPLEVTVREPGAAARLGLDLRYAVCKDICVPARARLVMPIEGKKADAFTAARLDGFIARVPQPAALGAAGPLAVRRAVVDTANGKAALAVTVAAPAGARATLFAASADGNVGVPHALGGGRWRVPLSGKAPRAVELVLAADGRAVSVPVALDGAAARP